MVTHVIIIYITIVFNQFFTRYAGENRSDRHINTNYDQNYNEIIDPLQEYEDHILNELCPNPDHMTYEQMLELQEKVGHVSKGMLKKDVEVC